MTFFSSGVIGRAATGSAPLAARVLVMLSPRMPVERRAASTQPVKPHDAGRN